MSKMTIEARLQKLEKLAGEENFTPVLLVNSDEEYEAFIRNGGKCGVVLIDDIPRTER